MSCLPTVSRKFAEPLLALAGLQRLLARRRKKRLRLGERFLPRIDRATEVAIGRVRTAAQQHEQVVESHDRLLRFGGNDAAVSVDMPIARRTGQHQVARLRDRRTRTAHAASPASVSIAGSSGSRAACRRAISRSKPRQRNVAQCAGSCAAIAGRRATSRRAHCRAWRPSRSVAVSVRLQSQRSGRIDKHAAGKRPHLASPPPFSAHVSGRHGRLNEIDQRIEIGIGCCRLAGRRARVGPERKPVLLLSAGRTRAVRQVSQAADCWPAARQRSRQAE